MSDHTGQLKVFLTGASSKASGLPLHAMHHVVFVSDW